MRLVRISKENAAKIAGEKLSVVLAGYGGSPVLLLLSGGSAFDILVHAQLPVDCSNLTIGMLDERFSAKPEENNFLKFQTLSFYAEAARKGVSFIGPVPKEGEGLGQFAQRLERALVEWKRNNPSGRMIATLGMGPDGHTAGIMPYLENKEFFDATFENTDRLVVGYDTRGKNPLPLRATATLPFLRSLNAAVVYIVGESKKPAFDAMQKSQDNLHEVPARIFHSIKNLEVITDIE